MCVKGKNHTYAAIPNRPACGCLSDSFKRKARINHWCAANQCEKDHTKYADTLKKLGRYHARDIYSWEGGKCGFHPQKKCTCKECPESDEPNCEGLQYTTQSPLTCPLHALAYEIEVTVRAKDSINVIHEEMGRGHSNHNEASHNVLIRYRSKDVALNRLHYIVSTNFGLVQSNMTWLMNKYGVEYHWLYELYKNSTFQCLKVWQGKLPNPTNSAWQIW